MSQYYYLAGPMRGLPEFNHPAFARISAVLRARGYTIANPAEKDTADGFDWTECGGTEDELAGQGFDIDEALFADINLIRKKDCAGVIVMEGWQDSAGARTEVSFAWATGRKVYRFFETAPGTGLNMPEFELVAVTHRYINTNYGEVHDKWLP